MKHLVAKEHHPHLKKRALLELLGLCMVIVLSFQQRDLIQNAFNTLRQSDLFYILLMILVYWLLIPLTPLSYRILLNKPLPIATTIIAQLAGSGAGRIIPGGLGHISIAAVHIAKSGTKLHKAIAVTLMNNAIGLLTSMVLVFIIVLTHTTLISTIANAVSPFSVLFSTVAALALLTTLQWMSHAHATKKSVHSITRELKKIVLQLAQQPNHTTALIMIATTITCGHVILLILSGNALGVGVESPDALIALSVGLLLGGAVPTPGGVGAVETGTTTTLIVLGYPAEEAVSITLLFRAVSYWMPLVPGLLAYAYLRERKLL